MAMSRSSAGLQNKLLILGMSAFLVMNLFGIFHSGMTMSADGKMSDCPFMPGMNVCPMSPLEHVSYMHDLFTNVPQQQNPMLAFLLLLMGLALVAVVWLRNLYTPPNLTSRSQLYFYRQRSLSIPLLFQELFSNGILNPKPF